MPRTAEELLLDLKNAGYRFEVRGGEIAIAPRPSSPATLAEVKRHEAGLLVLLSAETPGGAAEEPPPLAALKEKLDRPSESPSCRCPECQADARSSRTRANFPLFVI